MSATQTQNASVPSGKRLTWKRLLLLGLLAIIGSVLVNTLLRILALALLPIPAGFIQLQIPMLIVVFTVIGTLGAFIVFALINRFARNPLRLFRVVASVVLVLTFIPDLLLLSSPTANLASVATLIVMHIATYLVCVGAFTSRLAVPK